jgi:hypothetical protein
VRALQAGVWRYGLKRKAQRRYLHTTQGSGFQTQVGDALKRIARTGLLQHLEDATGQAEFMHGDLPEC